MATKEIQPKEEHKKDSIPNINTRQPLPNDENQNNTSESRQARTPKHANTKGVGFDGLNKESRKSFPNQDHLHPQSSRIQPHGSQQHYSGAGYQQYPHRDYRYEHRQGVPYSPSQQNQRQHFYRRQEQHMATVSPGTNIEYRQYYRDQHLHQDYQRFSNRYDGRSYGGDGRYDYSGYPPAGYQSQQHQHQNQQQHQAQNHHQHQHQHQHQHNQPHRNYASDNRVYGRPQGNRDYHRNQTPVEGRYSESNATPFTRAVSSSFDRSVKSRNEMEKGTTMEPLKEATRGTPPPDTSEAPSDDSSWRQLGQVASIDEAELQRRLADKKENKGRNILVNQPTTSNSSSLTNSPNEAGGEKLPRQPSVKLVDKAPPPTPSKLAALDSLSSVASGQEPLDTKTEVHKKTNEAPPSPGGFSAGSLDLMKCHSGSSGLLHGFPSAHHRGFSSSSLDDSKQDNKRIREERSDTNTTSANEDDFRRLSSTDDKEPQSKKTRKLNELRGVEQLNVKAKNKGLSLGIDCSPPGSPKGKNQVLVHNQRRSSEFNASPGPSSYFDKPPSYTYSNESNPSRERYNRPPSSSSSTITPMERPQEMNHPDLTGPPLPSWEIQAQDSFGNASGGGGIVPSFSFSNEYPMLPNSGSNLGYNENRGRYPPGHGPPPPVAESRNQSFDGHYHGGFNRSESIDHGYSHPQVGRGHYAPHENYKKQHQGPFPPQASSWQTTTSTGSHHTAHPYRSLTHYAGGYPSRGGPPPPHSPRTHPYIMNRLPSEDASRTSPPPPRIQSVPPRGGFQPPPEFAAPHNPHLNRRPPPAVYIMSTSGGQNDPSLLSKNRASGIYSWTKDDDMRLTEVMKKYKNPRDWEPVAKEHGRGKSAKECHERWIRYLKPGVRKGQWQDHEDAIVVEAVTTSTEQPFTRWSDLAQRLPGRVGKQIRDRWVNHLNPNINHLPFSREDDLLLWEGHKKLGKRWVEISTKYFNSTRSENHIKNRWYSASFKKFIANEFGPDAYSGGKPNTGNNTVSGKKGKKKNTGKNESGEAA